MWGCMVAPLSCPPNRLSILDLSAIVYFKRLDSRQNELKMYVISIWSRLNEYYAKLIHGVLGKTADRFIHYIRLTLKY